MPEEESKTDNTFTEFYNLSTRKSKEVIEQHVKEYYANNRDYSRECPKLSAPQFDTILSLRNSSVPAAAVSNSLKIKIVTLGKLIKARGFRWNVSTKLYVAKDHITKKPEKRLVEKTQLHNVVVEPSIYRVIALQAYLRGQTYSQIIAEGVLACATKEIIALAAKPSSQLNFHRLHLKK